MNRHLPAIITGGLTLVARLLTIKQRRERARVVDDAYAAFADGLSVDERLAVQRFLNRVLADAGLPARYPEAAEMSHGRRIDDHPALADERSPRTVSATAVRVIDFHPRRLTGDSP